MQKIMLIEDDSSLRNQVKDVLIGYGYEVYAVETFFDVEEQFKKYQPDLMILDINLPHFDGNYYCRVIRKYSKIPIVITSARNSDMDQILSIEVGADDYIVKPFSIQVLIVKINALMRRLYGDYSSNELEKELVVKGIHLDNASFKVSYQNASKELSKNEYKLLKKFLLNADSVISRVDLLEELWDESSFVDDNTLTVNVTRVKSKLTEMGLEDMIKTKRGAGYLFDTSSLMERNGGSR